MNQITNRANPLFILAKSGKRIPHIVIAILLSFFIIISGMLLGSFIPYPKNIINNAVTSLALQTSIKESFENITQFSPIIILLLIWLHFYEKRTFTTLGFTKQNAFANYIKGIVTGTIMFCLFIVIVSLLGFFDWENGNPLLEGKNMILPVTIALLGYFIQGATEEIIFRGWLLPVLGARYSPVIGITVSSILFGLLHSMNENVTVLAIINIIIFGVFLAFYALRHGNLWGVCAWHSVWNWLQGNFFGLEVSGNSGSPTILNLIETGPDWFTGGNFGPEGGFACTIVLSLGVFITFYYKKNTET